MYFDTKPCSVCGSDVELRPRQDADGPGSGGSGGTGGPVGPSDGVVGDADSTVDERFCTNADCPTHASDGPEA